MKSSDLIIDLLIKNGVNRAWYVQGGAISHVIDSAYLREVEKGDFKSIFVQHEQAAGFAADAYSRCGEKIGAVMVTSGPGATNVMTSIASSWYDSVPVIYLTGQVRSWEISKGSQRQKGFQETDIVSMTKDITKYSVTVLDESLIRYEVEKAIFLALNGRPGPVVIDLPMEMQWADISKSSSLKYAPSKTPFLSINDHKIDKINEVSKLLRNAERPVILVGGGVRSREDAKAIKTYADKQEIAVVTSFSGKHLFDDSWSNNFGYIGTMGKKTANEILHKSDVALVVGSRLSWRQIRSDPDNFSKLTKVIHVDIDSGELNENIESFITLNLDAQTMFEYLLKDDKLGSHQAYLDECQELNSSYSHLPLENEVNEHLHPHNVIDDISQAAGSDSIFCLDTGQNLIWAIQGLESRGNRKFISSWGHSPMGYSICAALGAAEVNGIEEVVCIIGDGGIQMNIQELQTIFLNKYNIKILIVNNNALGAIKEFQDDNLSSRHFGTGSSLNYESPNFENIGLAYGIPSTTVKSSENLVKTLSNFFNKEGPGILDIKICETAKMKLSLEKFN